MARSIADFANDLDLMPPELLQAAAAEYRLRRQLPTHVSDLLDAYKVARGYGMTLCQAGALLAYLARLGPATGGTDDDR
ncbi:hypothetical protein ACFL6X_06975 [Candidatus Latescibacterota bacterium]